jgi:two-component system CheB/CheR fusion protein
MKTRFTAHETQRALTSAARFPIVGIGASAGGLEAFTCLLKHLPTDSGMAFVLVQHLDPQHESALPQLLARVTPLPVREAANRLRVEPNHIYVIPPNSRMTIAQGLLKLRPRAGQPRGGTHSIDFFFESLAQDQSDCAIGVVLSGTATDGTLGLEAIKAEGGITFAQDDSAKYDSMPRSAVGAGCVDFVLSPVDIAKELVNIAKHPSLSKTAKPSKQAPATETQRRGPPGPGARQARTEAEASRDAPYSDEQRFKKILLLLRNRCGVDFSLYKSTTIQRRLTRRMVLNKQNTPEDYAAFLKSNPRELDALYSDVLINVTNFFRNPEAFETLKRKVFPALLGQSRRGEPLRVWVPGCSTGQEAYSIVMAYLEASEGTPRRPAPQVFATDLNEALLDKARHGLYAKTLATDLSPERLARFFVEEDGGYRIAKPLRDMVVFARQNVVTDPPFSRIDLISCRNLFIYLEPALQQRALAMFHYSLKPGGYLFLGASESVAPYGNLFAPIDKSTRSLQ